MLRRGTGGDANGNTTCFDVLAFPSMRAADLIRARAFAHVVLSDIDAESAMFTVGEIHDLMPQSVQQQQVLGACTARKPLEYLGIRATQQGGFHANREQEIRWEWDARRIKPRP